MKLTEKLKQHARQYYGVAENADDASYQKAVADRLLSGELNGETFADLTADKAAVTLSDLITDAVTKGVSAELAKVNPGANGLAKLQGGPSPVKVFGAGNNGDAANGDAPNVRVKAASEMYSNKKSTGRHVKTGEPVVYQGRDVELPSERELAEFGAFMRMKALRSGAPIRELSEHERALIAEMIDRDEFGHEQGGEFVTVKGNRVKALLDDSTSGGQELVPIWFDDMIVTFPLLHSELLPFVEIREVPRSSRVEAASVGNPTVSWGTAEGTAFSLFSTTALAAAIDTTIHPVFIGVEEGIDMLSDSPVNVGQILQQNIGEAALKELDVVIATGNGTNRPQGLSNATAGTTITTVNGAGGPWTVDDLEALIFGVGKQYRALNLYPCFVANDTTYKRWRAISVSAVDERRVFGMDHQSYRILEYPVKIQNDIGNGSAFFTCLRKFRLYRRRGFDLRTVTEGQTLALKNTMLIVGRGRYGGKIVDSSALAKTTTGQS